MEKILVPNKTFKLYAEGVRTFIHVLRDEIGVHLKETLRYGDAVLLANKETNEELEQTFWFSFDFKENDRFFIFVFQWNAKSRLFYIRRQYMKTLTGGRETAEYVPFMGNYQKYSYHMLEAYSALFYVDARNATSEGTYFRFTKEGEEGSSKGQWFVVTDVLRLKKEKGNFFEVYSVFPLNLINV